VAPTPSGERRSSPTVETYTVLTGRDRTATPQRSKTSGGGPPRDRTSSTTRARRLGISANERGPARTSDLTFTRGDNLGPLKNGITPAATRRLHGWCVRRLGRPTVTGVDHDRRDAPSGSPLENGAYGKPDAGNCSPLILPRHHNRDSNQVRGQPPGKPAFGHLPGAAGRLTNNGRHAALVQSDRRRALRRSPRTAVSTSNDHRAAQGTRPGKNSP